MTKEEIINECKQRLGFETNYEMYTPCQHEKDFLNAIIKALDQQPSDETIKYLECNDIDVQKFTEAMKKQRLQVIKPNICDDCVSRQAVLNTLFYKSDNNCEVVLNKELQDRIKALPPVTPTQSWIPLVWDEYPTVDIDGNDDYVYAVDYSVPMPKEDEWVLITDVNHNVVIVQHDGYDFGDYAREDILAWSPLPKAYEEKGGNEK